MAFRMTFMISLILLIGCAEEKSAPDFNENEHIEYEKLKADYPVPDYKWGYISTSGQLQIEDKYHDLREFNNGLAAVCLHGLWGYVDNFGNEVIPVRHRTVKAFSEGIAVGQKLNGLFNLYTKNGELLKDSLHFKEVDKFQEGKSIVNDGFKFGYLDTSGQLVIEPQYKSASRFKDGIAIVEKESGFGMINHKNKVSTPLIYDKIWFPSNGFIRFKKAGKFGFIDNSNQKEVFNTFASATDFQGEHALINDGNSYSLLTVNDEIKRLPYSFVDVGGEGKWMYAVDDKFGFLNNDGSVLTLPQYDLLMRYREGRAGYSINNVWGYLDESGNIAIPAQYPLVWDFVNGYARMIGQYGFGFIDTEGSQILEARYMEVRDFSEGLARIQVYR